MWTKLHVSEELRALWLAHAAAARRPPSSEANAKYNLDWAGIEARLPGRSKEQCGSEQCGSDFRTSSASALSPEDDDEEEDTAPGAGGSALPSSEAPIQRPAPCRRGWTAQEDGTIVELARRHGAKWRKISGELPGRSDSAIRNRWQRLQARHAADGSSGQHVPAAPCTSSTSSPPVLPTDEFVESSLVESAASADSADELEAAVSAAAMWDIESWLKDAEALPPLPPQQPSQALLPPLPPVSPPPALSPPLSPPAACGGDLAVPADYSIRWRSLEFRCAATRGRFHQSTAAPVIESVMRHLVVSIVVPLQLLMSCKVSQEKFGRAFLLAPGYYATLPHEWVSSLCSLLLLVCWRWRARLRIGLGVFSSVVYLGAVASLVAHQAILLHRCPDDPRSMSCDLAVKVHLHDPDVRPPALRLERTPRALWVSTQRTTHTHSR